MPRVIVTVSDARGRPVRAGRLARWLASAAPASARGLVAIALVSDRTMRRLNLAYRGADYATDVLSFPVSKGPRGSLAERPARAAPQVQRPLGDIAIALGVARRQAHARGHSPATEIRVLALHGLLHLLGYDHEVDRGQMQRTEERLRRRAGLPAGLIARAPARSAPR